MFFVKEMHGFYPIFCYKIRAMCEKNLCMTWTHAEIFYLPNYAFLRFPLSFFKIASEESAAMV